MTMQQHPWSRYVALGDSFTEGIGDPEPASPGGHRGWADRVAEVLSAGTDDFAYAQSRRARQADQSDPRRAGRAGAGAAPRPHHDLRRRQRRDPAGQRPGCHRRPVRRGDRAARAATARRSWCSPAPMSASPPCFRGLRGKVAIYNENIRAIAAAARLHRRRPVVADGDPGPADVGARPAAPEPARPSHRGAAWCSTLLNVPNIRCSRWCPSRCRGRPGVRPAPRTSPGHASTWCRGCCGACGTSRPGDHVQPKRPDAGPYDADEPAGLERSGSTDRRDRAARRSRPGVASASTSPGSLTVPSRTSGTLIVLRADVEVDAADGVARVCRVPTGSAVDGTGDGRVRPDDVRTSTRLATAWPVWPHAVV